MFYAKVKSGLLFLEICGQTDITDALNAILCDGLSYE